MKTKASENNFVRSVLSVPSKVLIILIILVSHVTSSFAQDIPDRPDPPRLVNDFAGILNPTEVTRMESRLVKFNDSSSTQITIVTVKSLNGYDKNDFAQRLGQKWGVGQKGKNNGVVVLIKPKYSNEKGEAAIQTGYGLEGVLPDVTCKRIVENEMIPRFREGDYYAGINAAVNTIISISRNEFTAEQYNKRTQKKSGAIAVPILILIGIFIWVLASRKGNMHSVGKSLPFWASMMMLSSMGRGSSGGSWGSFSSGSGGGGFGGFGGGSFGGGGAGGSW